jgi:DNA-binding transcriptional ArsR family regulator
MTRKHDASTADTLAEIQRRLGALERTMAGDAEPRPPGPSLPGDRFWLLERLARNTGPAFSRGEVAGSLAYGGRVRAPGAGELVWQLEHPAPDVLDADLEAVAAVLGALGHPLRLEIVRRLLLGARTLAELQEIPGTGTSGQLQHHLRELRAAGLVTSERRNHYAVPADRVVPLLVMIAAALGRGLADEREAPA